MVASYIAVFLGYNFDSHENKHYIEVTAISVVQWKILVQDCIGGRMLERSTCHQTCSVGFTFCLTHSVTGNITHNVKYTTGIYL